MPTYVPDPVAHFPTSVNARKPSLVHYLVEVLDARAHLFQVTLQVHQPQKDQQLSLPAWIPGSYLIREFARHLQDLRAFQQDERVSLVQADKHSWRARCHGDAPLTVRYQVYAADNSVRSAFLDTTRAFFNGTSLFLRVDGCDFTPHSVELRAPSGLQDWRVATALPPQNASSVDTSGWGRYQAENYDQLVDCPVEMGRFWQGHFRAGDIEHRFVVSGAGSNFDSERLLSDAQKICACITRFWHGDEAPVITEYVFLLNAVGDGYGGLEHRSSTALIAGRRDLPRTVDAMGKPWKSGDGYTTLLGLISHEYFHTWNVKRLRPADFEHYDYSAENYTELLWFFEGFTSYYDDLLLVRAGVLQPCDYLKLLNKTINQVLQTPGRHLQSVAQSSFDAWIKYYRQDENTPNATVSYYTKGALVALCLDLQLRREGVTTLDAVMRDLWRRCSGGPMRETDVLSALQSLSGRSYAAELKQWVHSTEELPLVDLLAAHGVRMEADSPQPAQQLGLRMVPGDGMRIKGVLRGGLAEKAGMAAGDEWLGIDGPGGAWRLQNLDDLAMYLAPSDTHTTAIVARDQRLLRLALPLVAPPDGRPDTVRLRTADEAQFLRWLHDQ